MAEITRAQAAQRLVGEPGAPASEPCTGTDTVTIACNLPNGLILRVCEQRTEWEANQAGGRPVDVWRPNIAKQFIVRGNSIDINKLQQNIGEYNSVGGYALTPGCPRDLWDKWEKQNAGSDIVMNRCIFASSSEAHARGAARELAGNRSGLEPIDPDSPATKSPELRRLRPDDGVGR